MAAQVEAAFPVHRWSLLVAAAIALCLLVPLPEPPLSLRGWSEALRLDKLVHLLLFFLAARPWRRSVELLGVRPAGLATVLLAALFGAVLELVQEAWTATRSAQVGDVAADAFGALLGVVLLGRRNSTSTR